MTWLKRSARFRPILERPDVLAGRVLRRQRRRASGNDVGEVHWAFHRILLLAPHDEVGSHRLVGLRVHAHAADQVVQLEPLEGLHHSRDLGRFGLVHSRERHARHAISGRRRVAGRVTELGLIALDELARDRRVRRVIEVRADPEVLANFRVELDQLLHARRPRQDQRDLRGEAKIEDLARAGDGVETEVDHGHHGPMMNFAPSESTASSARRVALPAFVSSSRVMYLIVLPWTFIPRSSSASFMPRSRTGPTSEKAPVNDQRPSMTTSFGCARSTAGKPTPSAAAALPSFTTSRRVSLLMSILRAPVGSLFSGGRSTAR